MRKTMSNVKIREKTSKHWCVMWANKRPADIPILDNVEYTVWGHEVAPTTDMHHLQGYVCFVNRKSLRQVKKMMPGAHLDIKKGTPLEASTYCKKPEDEGGLGWIEVGTLPETNS